MIRCVITIHITCNMDDDDYELDEIIEVCKGVEAKLIGKGFLFTDIEQERCDLKRVYMRRK